MLFHNQKGNKRHIFQWLMMALCCLIPIALIFILPRFNITSRGISGILTLGLILLCPLMHLFMMKCTKK